MIAALILALQLGAEVPLDNPREEARAQSLMREIRCVVCESEPVSQSMADIAIDMRRAIRSQVSEGKTDGEVRKFFAERYGQYVLFRPPMSGTGLLLWGFPFALLAGVGAWLGFKAFRGRQKGLAPLSEDDVTS